MNSAAITWIGGAIVGFLIWWPIGVCILGCVLITALSQQFTGYSQRVALPAGWRLRIGGTGNTAFDEYRDETLRRLEADQQAFGGFMDKVRRAKDRAEFDQF